MTAHLMKRRGALDLSDWSIGSIEAIAEHVSSELRKRARDLAREIFDAAVENDAKINFAITGGDAPDDPLAMTLILGDIAQNVAPIENDTSLEYVFSLRDTLTAEIELCREDGSYAEELTSISAALKSFAADIDAVIASAP